jgi:hypothetical protein
MASDFDNPPAADFDVVPSRDEIEFFAENGYLVVDRLTTDEELEWLREIYTFVFADERSRAPGAPVDLAGSDGIAHSLSQAFFPELRVPALLATTHHRNARRYAAALLGVGADALTSWGHMIRKRPGGRAAPWHQDRAYWLPELDYHAVGSWLPLCDVTAEMGAMQFIPGSHRRGLLPHRHADAPVHNNLVVDAPFDAAHAVACPLRAGGATFHHALTLHFTAPNTTATARLAYPVEFETTPRRRNVPLSMPWVDERRALYPPEPLRYVADGRVVQL